MIRQIKIANFRSLKNVEIGLENDLTALVGENDSGKTSIIDALKIIFENKDPEIDDFYWGTDEIHIEVEVNDMSFIKKFSKDSNNNIQSKTMVRFDREFLERIREDVNSDDFDLLADGDKREKLISYASVLGVQFRSNIGTDTLKDRVVNRIDEHIESGDSTEGNIPNYNIYFLDGKHFESISRFFQEVFFKEKSRDIWYEEVKEGRTIEDIIREKLEEYAENLKTEIEERGIKDKLKSFLRELTEISVNPIFEPKGINIGVEVQLLEEDGRKISVEKKGDGTKRRITMALLEYKKAKEEEPSFYVFDEPDTHLHVKAQVELLSIIRQFNESEKQVVITTHSPFIMNSVKPRQIRLLSLENGETKIKPISTSKDVEWTLRSLGIENVNLFFSRRILIVEGDTEETFIPLIYEKLSGNNLYSVLVKVINRKGITNVPRFAEILSEFVKPEDIFILVDNDADEETKSIIEELEIPEENVFVVGHKEFEDAFKTEIIYMAWKRFVENRGKEIGEEWTIENIERLREECIKDGKKLSEKLRSLNKGCLESMKKTKLARALAEYCEREHLPDKINELLGKLR